MLDLFLGILSGALALVIGLGAALLGKDCFEEESLSNDFERENTWMPKEETIIVDGCRIIIRYPDQTNPDAMKQIRALLEKQRIAPEKVPKFDANKRKCDNNDRKCTLKTE